MCGIVGHFRIDLAAAPPDEATAGAALASLRFRGPDGQGQWRSADGRCWLGHTRLAVIDLPGGAQPMHAADGACVSFNGEIYNYRALRHELGLLGHRFRTDSDTEVLLHGYRAWGGPALVKRLQGLFAFAVYDERAHTLFLARDHQGVKPLFWWSDGTAFIFASEIKALLRFPAVQRSKRVNPAGVAQTLVTRYVAGTQTLLQGVQRLPQASYLTLVPGRAPGAPQTYWDTHYGTRAISDAQALEELAARLHAVVEQQLVADVPVGVQLSGGVDSSVVTALMDHIRRERGSTEPVKTFSVGFDGARDSELPFARQVAQRFGTAHHEIVIGPDDFVQDLARLCWFHDEPMGEPSAIPGYYMCRRAREHVTVMLCGEGADEQLGGYSKYTHEAMARRLDVLPARLRRPGLRALAALLPFRARALRRFLEIAAIPSESMRFASWAGCLDALQQPWLLSPAMQREVGDGGLREAFEAIMRGCDSAQPLERFLYNDSHARMVGNILLKADRLSMAAGIEARVPFLDHTFTEFAASLPHTMKIRGRQRKWLLKQFAARHLPGEIIHRRKIGFNVPLAQWFAGPLAPVIEQVLLSPQSLARGYYAPDALRALVRNHVERRVDSEQALWVLLAIELWHRLYIDEDGGEPAIDRVQEAFVEQVSRGAAAPAGARELSPAAAGSAR